ncbi:hypothetical protein E6O75_ATG05732 [Venturia nashicola]|uniref:Rhodopsin domain-containing protein n=1 Tax=Venturia nashicola TaxID=86259 RepID=A0A4Z1NYF2_9PEZI|nr:hypothetical protein E6O75_ATG05732 [Venturia nashicola]
MAPISCSLALAVLIPLPFDIVVYILRFWVRHKRTAWGPDDWAMLVNIPFWAVTAIATIALVFSGAGARTGTLSADEVKTCYMWFYIFQEPWCFTVVTIKCSIAFALIRICNRKRWIEWTIYASVAACFIVIGGTGVYLYFRCNPVQKNWIPTLPGVCQERSIQTVLLYAVAVVSIATDWIFAVLPIFLLWNVQLDWRVKGPVVIMLGLGIFASIAPIVRLKYIIGLNDHVNILENLGTILAWASIEVNVGMFVANLPACRPILEQIVRRSTSWTSSVSHTRSGGESRCYTTRRSRPCDSTPEQWALEERPVSSKLQNYLKNGQKTGNVGVRTRIYGDADEGSSITSDHLDGGSQKNMVRKVSEDDRFHVNIHKDFRMEVSREDSNPRTPDAAIGGYVKNKHQPCVYSITTLNPTINQSLAPKTRPWTRPPAPNTARCPVTAARAPSKDTTSAVWSQIDDCEIGISHNHEPSSLPRVNCGHSIRIRRDALMKVVDRLSEDMPYVHRLWTEEIDELKYANQDGSMEMVIEGFVTTSMEDTKAITISVETSKSLENAQPSHGISIENSQRGDLE